MHACDSFDPFLLQRPELHRYLGSVSQTEVRDQQWRGGYGGCAFGFFSPIHSAGSQIIVPVNILLGLYVFLCRASWTWTPTLQEHLQDTG